jgi:hypothetical protein
VPGEEKDEYYQHTSKYAFPNKPKTKKQQLAEARAAKEAAKIPIEESQFKVRRSVGRPCVGAEVLDPTVPTTYDPNRYPYMVYRLRMLGLSKSKIAEIFLVTPPVLEYWLKQHTKFREAYEEGGTHADGKVVNALFKRATGWKHKAVKIAINTQTGAVHKVRYVENFAPETSAAQYWLNNRQPHIWKNRSSSEVTGANGEALSAPTIIVNPIMAPPKIQRTIEGDPQVKQLTQESEDT